MKERCKYFILAATSICLVIALVGGVLAFVAIAAKAFSRKPTMMRCGRENLFVVDEYSPGFLLLHCKDSKQEFVITLVDE